MSAILTILGGMHDGNEKRGYAGVGKATGES